VCFGTEVDRCRMTKPSQPPAGTNLWLLGVTHDACIPRALTRLERAEVALPEVLPALSVDEAGEYIYEHHLPPDSRRCQFCSSPDDLTEEHIWPRWFSRALIARGASFTTTRNGCLHQPRLIDFTIPICKSCNNTWLSVLENDVSRLAQRMLRRQTVTLDAQAQLALATWAAKVAYMIDSFGDPTVPRGYSEALRLERRPSDSTYVWLSAYDNPSRAVIAWQQGFRFPDQLGWRPDTPNAFVVTFTAFCLIFQVFGHFNRGGATLRDGRDHLIPALIPIWPVGSSSVTWPPRYTFGDDSIDLLVGSFDDGTGGSQGDEAT
jgi:hypothetical protein